MVRVRDAAETIPTLFAHAEELARRRVWRRSAWTRRCSSPPSKRPAGRRGPTCGIAGEALPGRWTTDVTLTVYEDARHEIFNETNRDEVTADVIRWLTARAGRKSQAAAIASACWLGRWLPARVVSEGGIADARHGVERGRGSRS